MRLTFKTLKNTTFVLDVEETEKVIEVKEKIKSAQSKDFGDSKLKLICSGRVMEDDKTIKEYSIGEKSFIVVMSTVAKPEKKEPKPEPIKKPEPTPAPDTAAPKAPTATVVPSNPVEPGPVTGSSDLLSGESLTSAIQNLMEMGFERSQVEQALRMSFNNPDRAAEYLLSGNIPTEEPQPTTETTEQQPPETQQTASLDSESLRSLSSEELVHLLSTFPQFQQLRALRGNSAALTQLMQQLSYSYPELINAIQENESAFLDFVNSDPDPSAEADAAPGGGRQHHIIRLTEEDKNAVDRLKALGFPEDEVIQAYFACEKNEDLAANLLFSDNPDDAV